MSMKNGKNMETKSEFKEKIEFGNKLEQKVCESLSSCLSSDYEVRITNQEFRSNDREKFKTCDVVVIKDSKTVFGIECKIGDSVYRKCFDHNGWSSDDNIVLNKHSIDRYEQSDFPFFILNLNVFSRKVFWIDVKKLNKVRHSIGYRKSNYCNSSDEVVNYNGGEWNEYKGVSLEVILGDIIKVVGI